MFLTHYLLLLFLLALQAQNARTAPIPGHEAVVDTESAPSAPELEPDSMLIPSWYLKRKDPQRIPVVPTGLLRALVKAASETDHDIMQKIFPMGESNSLSGSDEETEAVTDTTVTVQHERHSGRSPPEQKGETAGLWILSKNYILMSIAVSAVLLFAAVVGYIVMYHLLNRDMRIQRDKEASAESNNYSCLGQQ